MQRVLRLLDERNHYLQKFEALNVAQMDRMERGDFEGVEEFYRSREGILENIGHLEKLLEAQLRSSPPDSGEITEGLKLRAQEALSSRDQIVKKILDQDLAIISFIEEAKSRIIRELTDLRKGRSVLGAYRSPSHEKQLDEKY